MNVCALALITSIAFASCAMAQTHAPVIPQEELFPLHDIRLTGGPLKEQQELNRKYLLKLEPDRLLSWFRKEAGLEQKAPPYLGWESQAPFLPGHILGFYMSGAAMTVQATDDEVLRERLLYIVDELAEVQRANGSGYALAVPNGKGVFKEIASGRIEIAGLPWNGYQINGHFEPTYTMNKILLGLYQILQATGSEKAKQVFLRLSDWFGEEIVNKLDDTQLQTLLQCEHGSLPETYVNAYELTGDTRYLNWSKRLCHERMLAPLAKGDEDFLTHFHANSNIPKYTGFENVYRITGDDRLHRAAMNAWKNIVERRSWVIGGNSAGEHFFAPDEFGKAIHNPVGPELCNSINMLRLTEAVFRTEPSTRLMDYYERVLFNHILVAHDNERCMANYYIPMFPGAYRVYSDEFDSMWCCTGTGLEVPGKYGQMIYTHTPDNSALDVNLFAPSELNWSERHVTVRQETGFPYEQATTLTIDAPETGAEFALRVRHPAWVQDGKLGITLNGESVANNSGSGSCFTLRRVWKKGDVLRVELPMRLSTETLPLDPDYVAFLYGPLVLSGELGCTDGLVKEDFWGIENKVPLKLIPEGSVPGIVASNDSNLTRLVQPVAGKPLHFRSNGFYPNDVNLVPFFENHFQRYAIYWRKSTPEKMKEERERLEREARERAELDSRTVDRILIGNDPSEKEHDLQGAQTDTGAGAYGQQMDHNWRDARNGGWFSYRLKVGDGSGPRILHITYWGREQGARKFDILVDDKLLVTESLGDTGKSEFLSREIMLPVESLNEKSQITVKFQAHPGNSAGGVFDLRMLNR